jgi:hypothetical protein
VLKAITRWIGILPVHQIGYERASVGALFIGLPPSPAKLMAVVIEHQINVAVVGQGRGEVGIRKLR